MKKPKKKDTRNYHKIPHFADGGAVEEPTTWDWTKAQATDLYETGKRAVGLNEPTYRGGTYEPFKNTKAVRDRAVKAGKKDD